MAAGTSSVIFRVLTESDKAEVVKLVCQSFLIEEPLCACLHLQAPQETDFHADSLLETCVRDAISVIALDRDSDKIIGCRLSTIETATSSSNFETSPDNPDHKKLQSIGRFMGAIEEGVDIFDRYGVDSCVCFQMLNVLHDYRNKGIGKQLVIESERVARLRGFRVFKVVASNMYTVKLYDRLEYDRLNEKRYDQYTDEDGHVVFANMGIHGSAVLFAKKIN